ncbi:MAG: calcium/sodium antiporter [Leptospiraceae bacterium]|nr:calcium/sodium antiporter [Leptospiraceae bacterium]
MGLFFWIAVFIASLLVLIKTSDYFLESAEQVGYKLGLSSYVVGVLIVGFGTSLPELVSSILSVYANASEIVTGNTLGSNITNIFLIFGIAALFSKSFTIEQDLLKIELPFLLTITFLISFFLMDGKFHLLEGIFCLVILGIYIWKSLEKEEMSSEKTEEKSLEEFKKVYYLILLISPIFIFVSAKYVVDSVIKISEIVNVGKEMIALSAVALGTSLPEVIVTIAASRKGNPEIAVGNVIGSNVFNLLAVLGIPRLLGDITIPPIILSSVNYLHIAATLLFVIVVVDKKVNRHEGILFLMFYFYYLGLTFGLF